MAAPIPQSSAALQRLTARAVAAPHEIILPCEPHEMIRAVAAVAPSPPASTPPTLKLSDFDKIGNLGEGACGVVTKVRHRGSGAVFALKTAYCPEPNAEEEAEVLGRVGGSTHVVHCYAIFRGAADEPAMLLELMDAGSLGRVLRHRGVGRGLPELALAEVAARCLAGLAHLHSCGVAHLDLKPDNLLVSARGDVKIGDFSVSRIFSRNAGERLKVSISVGSTAYMSPERFVADARAGPRGACAADIWGLGFTVLELLLGRRPILPAVEKPTWGMLVEAICSGEPLSVPKSASPSLRGFVSACLQKDPRRRATVSQLLAHSFVAWRDIEASRRALREIIMQRARNLC